jgi:acyl carrier protein
MKIQNKELLNLISKALNVPAKKINDKSKSMDFEEWDSLGQLAIITSIDKKFKGKLNLALIAEADNVKKISNFLKKKKVLI